MYYAFCFASATLGLGAFVGRWDPFFLIDWVLAEFFVSWNPFSFHYWVLVNFLLP